MLYSVITGDIINFTSLDDHRRKTLIDDTRKLLKSWVSDPSDAEIFRGDSFQLIQNDHANALKRVIQLLCWFKKYLNLKDDTRLGARIALGIGSIAYKGSSILDSEGEAFHLSGRGFDKMEQEILIVKTPDDKINEQIAILLRFINQYINKWTSGQAEVIYFILEGFNQEQTAQKTGIRQGAVNNRLKAAKWNDVKAGIDYISRLIEDKLWM